jgi:hypothetical protein
MTAERAVAHDHDHINAVQPVGQIVCTRSPARCAIHLPFPADVRSIAAKIACAKKLILRAVSM